MSAIRMKLLFRVTLLLLLAALMAVGGAVHAADQHSNESLLAVLEAPEPQLSIEPSGLTSVALPGFHLHGLPGDPRLPARHIALALPPDALLDSVRLTISTIDQINLPGLHQVAAAAPAYAIPLEEEIEDWGPNVANVVSGRNTIVYGSDSYFPSTPVEMVAASQMRKWRYVELRFRPISFNPVTGRLRLTRQVTISVDYQSEVASRTTATDISDTLMDDLAAQMFINYEQAWTWYESAEDAQMRNLHTGASYAIVTTNDIAKDSEALDDFIWHKRQLGFNVILVTEEDVTDGYEDVDTRTYGASTVSERPHEVRKWLQENYQANRIEYVLLIGNPNMVDAIEPTESDGYLPMLTTRPPYHPSKWDNHAAYPTDHYYADLTGDWDKSKDQQYGGPGDYPSSDDPSGVDFSPDVYVGRIPVYSRSQDGDDVLDVAALDTILRKTMAYELSTDRDWRRSALLPMPFNSTVYQLEDNYTSDMSFLGAAMTGDFLDDAGFHSQTMYFHTSNCTSPFASVEELQGSAVKDYWIANPSGIVSWSGHGSDSSASLGWNGCGIWGDLFTSEMAKDLNGERPAIAVLLPCSNGNPSYCTLKLHS